MRKSGPAAAIVTALAGARDTAKSAIVAATPLALRLPLDLSHQKFDPPTSVPTRLSVMPAPVVQMERLLMNCASVGVELSPNLKFPSALSKARLLIIFIPPGLLFHVNPFLPFP